MEIPINYLAVLVAGIASMGLGFLWYSPVLFGKKWMALRGFTPEGLQAEQKQMGKYYAISFGLALLQIYLLAHVMVFSMNFNQSTPVFTGLATGFFTWLGFVMPTQATATIFGDKKWGLWLIDTGYQLCSLLLAGLILGFWQ